MRACERETDARKRYFEEFSTLNNGMEILFIVDTLLLGERITRTMKRQKNRKRKRQKETCIKDYLLNKRTVFFPPMSRICVERARMHSLLFLSLSVKREQNEIDRYFVFIFNAILLLLPLLLSTLYKVGNNLKRSTVVTRLLAVFDDRKRKMKRNARRGPRLSPNGEKRARCSIV